VIGSNGFATGSELTGFGIHLGAGFRDSVVCCSFDCSEVDSVDFVDFDGFADFGCFVDFGHFVDFDSFERALQLEPVSEFHAQAETH